MFFVVLLEMKSTVGAFLWLAAGLIVMLLAGGPLKAEVRADESGLTVRNQVWPIEFWTHRHRWDEIEDIGIDTDEEEQDQPTVRVRLWNGESFWIDMTTGHSVERFLTLLRDWLAYSRRGDRP
jgi:hypothetical protein